MNPYPPGTINENRLTQVALVMVFDCNNRELVNTEGMAKKDSTEEGMAYMVCLRIFLTE